MSEDCPNPTLCICRGLPALPEPSQQTDQKGTSSTAPLSRQLHQVEGLVHRVLRDKQGPAGYAVQCNLAHMTPDLSTGSCCCNTSPPSLSPSPPTPHPGPFRFLCLAMLPSFCPTLVLPSSLLLLTLAWVTCPSPASISPQPPSPPCPFLSTVRICLMSTTVRLKFQCPLPSVGPLPEFLAFPCLFSCPILALTGVPTPLPIALLHLPLLHFPPHCPNQFLHPSSCPFLSPSPI